jgi:5-methylcytosine-specific restriction enzyme subunit McrC
MLVVELDELRTSQHRLTDEEGRLLAQSDLVTAAPSKLVRGMWDVTPKGQVGVARVGDVQLWIRPKLTITRLLFLLGYAADPKGWRDEEVELTTGAELVPAVANMLWRLTERAVRQGLLQGYREVEETALVLRGRLREADQSRRHHGRVIPMELRHDEFTVDIPENQILFAAVTRMLTVDRVDPVSRRRLGALRTRLAEVTTLIRSGQLPEWRPNRLNARYHAALRLAEVVWEATSPEHAPGSLTATGFLFTPSTIFEKFVAVSLGEALAKQGPGRMRKKFPAHLDEAKSVNMEMDLVWTVGGVPTAVVDAKYKLKRSNDNLYQMLAYCTSLGLRRGHLVYATGNAERHVVRHSGVEIVCHALDLTEEPTPLLARIDALARELTGH